MYCEPCNKTFKSNTLYMSHIKTKKHQKLVDDVMFIFSLLAIEEMRLKFGAEEHEEFKKYCLSLPIPKPEVKYNLPPNMWNNACKNIVRISTDLINSPSRG